MAPYVAVSAPPSPTDLSFPDRRSPKRARRQSPAAKPSRIAPSNGSNGDDTSRSAAISEEIRMLSLMATTAVAVSVDLVAEPCEHLVSCYVNFH
jgi:hypothetical protein